jgi:hypothetical protein
MVIVHLVLLWLSSEIQAWKELLDQLAFLKPLVTGMVLFAHP